MKFCINCKYFVPRMAGSAVDKELSQCSYFDRRHVVTGETDYWYASIQRNSGLLDKCGPDARFHINRENFIE